MQNESSDVLHQFHDASLADFEAAFETLFRRHQRQVYGWILRIVRNQAAAEDLTVETFWRIHQARARFRPEMGFEGWARRISTRLALDWLRTQRAKSELSTEIVGPLAAPSRADPAVSAEIRARVAEAFNRLPPKLRLAATLAVIEEAPQKDVAAALGISLVAVKLRVFRALRLLRKDLIEQGITP